MFSNAWRHVLLLGLRAGGAHGISWVETRDAANYPTMYRTAPTTKNYLAASDNVVKVEKPCVEKRVIERPLPRTLKINWSDFRENIWLRPRVWRIRSKAIQNYQGVQDLGTDMSGILWETDSKSDCLENHPPQQFSLMSQNPCFFVCAKGKFLCGNTVTHTAAASQHLHRAELPLLFAL